MIPLRPGRTLLATEKARAVGQYYESLGPSTHIILEDGPFLPLAPGPRLMDVLDRCRAFLFTLYCKLQSAIKCLHHGTKANNDPRLRGARRIGAGPSDEGRVLDVARVEKIEGDLNALIERRATQRDKANAEADLWAMSERRHYARLREERLRERLAYHTGMIRAHSETFDALLKKHRVGIRLCEEALGIACDEGAA